MPSNERDEAYLWDMRQYALEALAFTSGKSFKDFMSDRLLMSAVERNVEVIGEASRFVSDSLKEAHPEIDWVAILGQRNVLAHQYGSKINYESLWATVQEDLLPLVSRIDEILARDA